MMEPRLWPEYRNPYLKFKFIDNRLCIKIIAMMKNAYFSCPIIYDK